jgi:hypothetical protein
MNERLENSEETAFYNWCKKRFIPCYKLIAQGRKGFPDRTVFLAEMVLFFEFKRPGGTVSLQQARVIATLRALGHRVEVVMTAAEAKAVVEEYL